MALIRWQPLREMDSLQRDMNRLFETLAPMEEGSMQQSFMPLAEMEETEDAIHLKVEVPGMSADDLDVQVTKEAVMITGERKIESKSEKNGMKRSEFRYGRFKPYYSLVHSHRQYQCQRRLQRRYSYFRIAQS